MKRPKIKHAGAILRLWIVISGVLAGMATIWIVENTPVKNLKIAFGTSLTVLIMLVLWFLFPSLVKEEELSLGKVRNLSEKGITVKREVGIKCDAIRLNHPRSGFTCSILGDTVGANWVWQVSPYKEKILNPPDCDATVIRKKGIFGERCLFSCWIMGIFKVSREPEKLEEKVKQ